LKGLEVDWIKQMISVNHLKQVSDSAHDKI
jgi:hypothetical protein